MIGDAERLDACVQRGAVRAVGVHLTTAGLWHAHALAVGAALRCAWVPVIYAVVARRTAAWDGGLTALRIDARRLEAYACRVWAVAAYAAASRCVFQATCPRVARWCRAGILVISAVGVDVAAAGFTQDVTDSV